MSSVWIYTLLSVIIISLVSFVGVFLISIKEKWLRKLLPLLICYAIGALLGNSFFHLLPESFHSIHSTSLAAWLVVGGFLLFFVLEKVLHLHNKKVEVKTYGYLSLYSDSIHNFTDGILVAAAWMASPELGLSTTLAIVFHEVPQEISDFGILLKAGFTKNKALWYNFFVACTAILGAVLTLWIGHSMESASVYILPIAAGGFIYLAASNLLPEIVRTSTKKNIWIDLLIIILGLLTMFFLTLHGGCSHAHVH